MNTPQSPAMVEVDRLPTFPPFSQLVHHMLRDYVPSTVELQVAAAIRKYAKDYATEAIAAERADAERYRFLREIMLFTQEGDARCTMELSRPLPALDHNIHKDFLGELFDRSVDRTVDAARLAQKGGE